MNMFVVGIICAFLHVSHQNPLSHWTLLPHILVVEVDGSAGRQPLSCLESPEELVRRDIEDEDIIWRKNGKEQAQRGNRFEVQLEESTGGGNYTCHGKDGSLLNHTVVLLQEGDTDRRTLVKTDDEDYLKCSAQNYNGEFNCSWTWVSGSDGKVAFIKAGRVSGEYGTKCTVDASGHRWTCSTGQSTFSCTVDDSGTRTLCADEQYCPYAEESQHIHISVYILWMEYFLVENFSKHFHLSEIVKPDKVNIRKVNPTTIKWSYPSSWSSPYSYFPLTFEIAQLRRGCKRCENPCTDSEATEILTVNSTDICQFEVEHEVKAVCVRAKDALCNSQWSEWSHIRLSRHKKNNKNKRQHYKKPKLDVF